MPELLLEFFSEEIPARMQARAEADLERLLMDKLTGQGLLPGGVKAFAGPRRLAACVADLPARSPDVNEEKKGPRVGAPDAAVQGFLKSAGLSSLSAAEIVEDKKGAFYVARIRRAGRETPEIVAEIVPEIVRAFPWPKSMRSAEADWTWVRPLRAIVCAFDGEAVPVSVPGVPSGRETFGHRFHAPGAIAVRRFEDYEAALARARVVVRREARKEMIAADARTLCAAQGLELVEDAGLLEEVAGLAEWPVPILGEMDPAFLALPAEVIRLTMRTHQKYFAVRDPKTGTLAPKFVTVANIEAKDGGKAIASGNARVLSARLNDAQFFWAKDRETPLFTEARREKLKGLVFHAKLGSVWDKVERVEALARALAPACGADPELVAEAARLCKMDLVTETVGEFPELQGQIGRELYVSVLPREGEVAEKRPEGAKARTAAPSAGPAGRQRPLTGEHASIAAATEDHYRPLGPNDRVPTDPVAITLALADKLDTLAGFWAIDEKPTGSSDPYALRRAALGVVRIVLDSGRRLRLTEALLEAMGAFRDLYLARFANGEVIRADLLAFLADRLKVQLREQGKRHDLVDAVFAPNPTTGERDDDLVRIVARVEALDGFLKTEDGKNLLAGYRRAANILAAEAKKGRLDVERGARIDPKALVEPAEKALHAALKKAAPAAAKAAAGEDFAAAMRALAGLRGPVDAFFEGVLVNAANEMLRRNRLLLLTEIRDALHAVADFSRIEG